MTTKQINLIARIFPYRLTRLADLPVRIQYRARAKAA
jgi:hypothetical protein